jgi:hypothetical protein
MGWKFYQGKFIVRQRNQWRSCSKINFRSLIAYISYYNRPIGGELKHSVNSLRVLVGSDQKEQDVTPRLPCVTVPVIYSPS